MSATLHTRQAINPFVKKLFFALHARTFCHATEDLERIRTALVNSVGLSEIRYSRTEGHHGNPITVLETVVEDMDGISEFFSRLNEPDLREILRSLDKRIDESCNLFIRIDKQLAFEGHIRLTELEDVVSVRIRVRVFPSRCELAAASVKDFLEEELSTRTQTS